ncbi:MAG: response regulator, partial [Spirochaetota bacterium]|nr:response regulator [Spirochaetota bacterium]
KEKKTGQHIPIIALTAYASENDKKRCIDAGMDSYVSKPIQTTQLFDTIKKLMSSKPIKNKVVINEKEILLRVEHDFDLLNTLINLFSESYPKLMSDIQEAIKNLDSKLLEHSAHNLKGMLSNLAAKSSTEIALQLEKLGRDNNFANANEFYLQLVSEIEKLKPALLALTNEK